MYFCTTFIVNKYIIFRRFISMFVGEIRQLLQTFLLDSGTTVQCRPCLTMVAINSYKLLPSVTTIAIIHYMQFVFDALMTASDKTTFASIKVADVGDAVGWH